MAWSVFTDDWSVFIDTSEVRNTYYRFRHEPVSALVALGKADVNG